MAVTFHQIPSDYSPSDNPLRYTFSSDQTGQPNFSFRVETYINGVLVSNDGPILPENGDRAHFDASSVAKYRVPSPQFTNQLSTDATHIQSIRVRVIENYGIPPADQATLYSDLTYTFKSRLSDKKFIETDFDTDYVGKKFLTNYPRVDRFKILRKQDVYFSMIVGSSQQLEIAFFDENDVLLYTYQDTQNFQIWQLNLRGDILDALIPISIDDVAHMKVSIGASETLVIEYLTGICFTPHALLWLNEFGSFDTYVYTHNNQLSGSVSSKSYKKQFGTWVADEFNYSLENSGHTDFFKEVIDRGELTSEYITDYIQNWLLENLKGLKVLLYNLDGNKISINILNSTFLYDNSRFDELPMSAIQYRESNSHKTMTT